ncbi:MAG: ATP-grasp domain-containing protein [Planctomycetota bacterium]
MFEDQKLAIEGIGITASCFPESVIDDGKPISGLPSNHLVIYRGWMLNPDQYAALDAAVNQAGSKMLTSSEAYFHAHYLPNWYEQIQEHTPETIVIPNGSDYEQELKKLDWDQYFIKDYVKSITTSNGSIIQQPSQINDAIKHFTDYRGELEGGLCVRRVEDFIPATERRYFVNRGKAFGADQNAVPEIVHEVMDRIDLPFYSVDVIDRTDGIKRVVEIGDGQVSDLKEWTAESFASLWQYEA